MTAPQRTGTHLAPAVDAEGAAATREVGVSGGERNTSSLTNNYDATKHEATSYVLASSASAQNIGTSGTTAVYLMGVWLYKSTTGTITITGFTDPTGAAASIVIPAVTLSGAMPIQLLPAGNARRCESGCTITCSVAADGPSIVVDFRPIV